MRYCLSEQLLHKTLFSLCGSCCANNPFWYTSRWLQRMDRVLCSFVRIVLVLLQNSRLVVQLEMEPDWCRMFKTDTNTDIDICLKKYKFKNNFVFCSQEVMDDFDALSDYSNQLVDVCGVPSSLCRVSSGEQRCNINTHRKFEWCFPRL